MGPLRRHVDGRFGLDEGTTVLSVAEAFRATLDLFDTGLDLMRQNLRRRHPESSDDEIERRMGAWLMDRPGAEFGDCAGRPIDGLV